MNRPPRSVSYASAAVFGLSIAGGVAAAGSANWDLAIAGLLLAFAIASEQMAVLVKSLGVGVSGSFLAIVVAMVLLGGTPAALIAVLAVFTAAVKQRRPQAILPNVAIYASFPLVCGLLFQLVDDRLELQPHSAGFVAVVLALFATALGLNFLLVAAYGRVTTGRSIRQMARQALVPLLTTDLIAAVMAVGVSEVALTYGNWALALFAALLLAFQHLLAALLRSEDRAEELQKRTEQLASLQVGLLSAMLRTLDLRDRMTARHSAAVARYARELAIEAGLDPAQQELVHTAGLLHDIGKFVFPDSILKGSSRLTDEEYEIVKMHPYHGAQVLAQIEGYGPVANIVLAHHERIDGTGYPNGMRGDEIPLSARILSVCDTYDVMTSRDSYRKPVTSQTAIAELRRVSGTQLDGELVELFVKLLESKDVAYRHGEDADFETELALDRRVTEYAANSDLPLLTGLPTPPA
ncbi:MAG TPA: HD-GYP domain-containing protein [Thermoleophilaceae bacterium]|nr:HD-GYP domain-containing protein [Thermoleophilaceae bacterium]